MSKRLDVDLLCDIKEAIQRINIYLKDVSYDSFMEDIKTQDAIIRNLEIIGEAAKNVSAKLKKKHQRMPWKELAGVRDRLIHHYFGVNFDIVWTIATEELPALISQTEKILKNSKGR
jgi:uncharacterized protein with HEPN domain